MKLLSVADAENSEQTEAFTEDILKEIKDLIINLVQSPVGMGIVGIASGTVVKMTRHKVPGQWTWNDKAGKWEQLEAPGFDLKVVDIPKDFGVIDTPFGKFDFFPFEISVTVGDLLIWGGFLAMISPIIASIVQSVAKRIP